MLISYPIAIRCLLFWKLIQLITELWPYLSLYWFQTLSPLVRWHFIALLVSKLWALSLFSNCEQEFLHYFESKYLILRIFSSLGSFYWGKSSSNLHWQRKWVSKWSDSRIFHASTPWTICHNRKWFFQCQSWFTGLGM